MLPMKAPLWIRGSHIVLEPGGGLQSGLDEPRVETQQVEPPESGRGGSEKASREHPRNGGLKTYQA
jgi:hypothetical protein